MRALAWVQSRRTVPAGNPGSLSSAAAVARDAFMHPVTGQQRQAGEKRAPNIFQGAGKLAAVVWVATIEQCIAEDDGCVLKTGVPHKFPKRRPKRGEEEEKAAWRRRSDAYTVALCKVFGHRGLVRTKNPDHDMKSSTWHCSGCDKWLRTLLDGPHFDSMQMQGVTQAMLEEDAFCFVCAQSGRQHPPTHKPNTHTPNSHVPNSQVPSFHVPHTHAKH